VIFSKKQKFSQKTSYFLRFFFLAFLPKSEDFPRLLDFLLSKSGVEYAASLGHPSPVLQEDIGAITNRKVVKARILNIDFFLILNC